LCHTFNTKWIFPLARPIITARINHKKSQSSRPHESVVWQLVRLLSCIMVRLVGVFYEINFHLLNETIYENSPKPGDNTKHNSLAGQTRYWKYYNYIKTGAIIRDGDRKFWDPSARTYDMGHFFFFSKQIAPSWRHVSTRIHVHVGGSRVDFVALRDQMVRVARFSCRGFQKGVKVLYRPLIMVCSLFLYKWWSWWWEFYLRVSSFLPGIDPYY